jgi:hypothetical protein
MARTSVEAGINLLCGKVKTPSQSPDTTSEFSDKSDQIATSANPSTTCAFRYVDAPIEGVASCKMHDRFNPRERAGANRDAPASAPLRPFVCGQQDRETWDVINR